MKQGDMITINISQENNSKDLTAGVTEVPNKTKQIKYPKLVCSSNVLLITRNIATQIHKKLLITFNKTKNLEKL